MQSQFCILVLACTGWLGWLRFTRSDCCVCPALLCRFCTADSAQPCTLLYLVVKQVGPVSHLPAETCDSRLAA